MRFSKNFRSKMNILKPHQLILSFSRKSKRFKFYMIYTLFVKCYFFFEIWAIHFTNLFIQEFGFFPEGFKVSINRQGTH